MRARNVLIRFVTVAAAVCGLWGVPTLASTPAPERMAALDMADAASLSVAPAMMHSRGELPSMNAAISIPVTATGSPVPAVRGPASEKSDRLLLLVVALALVAYQLLRKHRQLRPQTFTH